MKPTLLMAALFLTGCAAQLPNTSLTLQPQIDTNNFFDDRGVISSRNGLLAENLTGIIGAICVPDSEHKCDNSLTASQCLAQTSKVTLKSVVDKTPKRHFLVNSKTEIKGNANVFNLNTSNDQLKEVTVSVLAVAQASDSTNGKGGFPGKDEIAKCLAEEQDIKGVDKVLWIKAANIISVTSQAYQVVANSAGVTLTGLGFEGKTYNKTGEEITDLLIGIDAREITLPNVETGNNVPRSRTRHREPAEDVNQYPSVQGTIFR